MNVYEPNGSIVSNHHIKPDLNGGNDSKPNNFNIGHNEWSLNEKKKRNSEDLTHVVKFQGIDENDSICSEDSERKLPPIPDGGWGWVVVVASFLASVCSDGLAYSFGVLHEVFVSYFGESQTKTSWIGSLFMAVPLISAPIISALVDRYGCRKMTMAASIIATGGFLLAAISNSVELLILTLGIISALAMSVLYVTSVVSVAFWFDKKRTLAISIASSGIGFGTLIYAPLTTFLLQHFDWRNTLILLSGTVLNMCVCGALMRDPDWVIIKSKQEEKRKKAKKAKLKKSSSMGSISIKSVGGESIILSPNELIDLLKSGQSPEYVLSILTSALAVSQELEATTQMNAELGHKRTNSTVDLPTFIHQNEQVTPEVMERMMSNKKLYNIIQRNYPHLIPSTRSEVNFGIGSSSRRNSIDSDIQSLSTEVVRSELGSQIKNEVKDYSTSVVLRDNREINLKPKTPQNGYSGINNSVINRRGFCNVPLYRNRASSLPDIYKQSTSSLFSKLDYEKKWYDPITKVLRNNFNFELLTEFHFFMFSISSFLMSIWSIIPFFFLHSYMSEQGLSGASNIVSIIGISCGIGTVVLGWCGDRPWCNVTVAYTIMLIVCGICVAAYPFVITNYPLLIVVSIIFGVSFGSSYSYPPAILMELVPIDEFTTAYGMVLMSEGLGYLVGPPLGGLLYDVTKSWNLTFIMGGGWVVVSGLCLGVIIFVKNVRMCGKDPLLKDMVDTKSQDGSDSV